MSKPKPMRPIRGKDDKENPIRQEVYWIRKRVPDKYRALVGKKEIWRSLGTSNLKQAETLCDALNLQLEREWAIMSGEADPTPALAGFTPMFTARPGAPLRRVMGGVLRGDSQMPQTIWSQHASILNAVMTGDGARAEMLSRDHISRASIVFVQRLQEQQASEQEMRERRMRRIR